MQVELPLRNAVETKISSEQEIFEEEVLEWGKKK